MASGLSLCVREEAVRPRLLRRRRRAPPNWSEAGVAWARAASRTHPARRHSAELALIVQVGGQPGDGATGARIELQAPCASSDGSRLLVSDGAERLAVTARLLAEVDGRERLVAAWAGS